MYTHQSISPSLALALARVGSSNQIMCMGVLPDILIGMQVPYELASGCHLLLTFSQ
jgi:hypothetical protein